MLRVYTKLRCEALARVCVHAITHWLVVSSGSSDTSSGQCCPPLQLWTWRSSWHWCWGLWSGLLWWSCAQSNQSQRQGRWWLRRREETSRACCQTWWGILRVSVSVIIFTGDDDDDAWFDPFNRHQGHGPNYLCSQAVQPPKRLQGCFVYCNHRRSKPSGRKAHKRAFHDLVIHGIL